MTKILINNKIVDEVEAMISIKDRGFRFGDGVFDTIAFYNKKFYRLEDHLERLKNGLNSIGIYHSILQIKNNLNEILEANNITTGFARISVTRGIGSRGYLPTYESEPSVVIEIQERIEMDEKPVSLQISKYRKIPLECVPSNQKLMNGLNYIIAKEEARKDNYFDGIMLSIDNKVCECAAANIFWIKADKLYTPSIKSPCLEGITRKVIIELSPLEVVEDEFHFLKLSGADEIFITNTRFGILPVSKVDPMIFKNGKGYKKTEKIRERYVENISNLSF